jgi:hypothetical protein
MYINGKSKMNGLKVQVRGASFWFVLQGGQKRKRDEKN